MTKVKLHKFCTDKMLRKNIRFSEVTPNVKILPYLHHKVLRYISSIVLQHDKRPDFFASQWLVSYFWVKAMQLSSKCNVIIPIQYIVWTMTCCPSLWQHEPSVTFHFDIPRCTILKSLWSEYGKYDIQLKSQLWYRPIFTNDSEQEHSSSVIYCT